VVNRKTVKKGSGEKGKTNLFPVEGSYSGIFYRPKTVRVGRERDLWEQEASFFFIQETVQV